MKVTPVKGTNDYLPREAELRDYLQRKICETYENCGFQRIFTPILEDIENLDKSDGGDNLNLIFKVLKRGAKLDKAIASGDPKNLADMGMRYDLTLPLSRYYANNQAHLSSPFKVIQIDKVYRAERPQKGRLREFMQCDIDILGEASNIAEIELVLATTTVLGKIGFKNFTIRINDRRILKAMAAYSGFPEESYDEVFIILDKMDKIGIDGVAEE
ncbi:MAG: ATP phosphoribosyltransferase regulatory subunit, partial [Lachnospiraceae bacterium]|nr:ATP phosphoribosyltransferase regulatory subunit [Lachnospiraceae bacterium]